MIHISHPILQDTNLNELCNKSSTWLCQKIVKHLTGTHHWQRLIFLALYDIFIHEVPFQFNNRTSISCNPWNLMMKNTVTFAVRKCEKSCVFCKISTRL